MGPLIRITYWIALALLLPASLLSNTERFPVAVAVDTRSKTSSAYVVVFHKGAVSCFTAWSGNHRGLMITVGDIGHHGFSSLRYGWSGQPMWWWPGMLTSTAIPFGTSSLGLDRGFAFPASWLILALILPPSMRIRRAVRRARRKSRGRCGECGYDLRATPERCPECGANSAPARQ